MRLLLTGRDGQVGAALLQRLAGSLEATATGRAELDLADPDAIVACVRAVRPDVIVNAAAYTQVDRAESEPELAMRVNARAPGILAEEAKRAGAALVHYSTDYVFRGETSRPLTEEDPTAPLNAYGRSKLAGEQAVLAIGGRSLVLRTSWVYAPQGRNFFLTIARKARAGERLRVVDDQEGVPTSAAFIARATLRALQVLQSGNLEAGLLHVVPDGSTSWCGFAREIARHVAPGVEVEPIASASYPQAARRPRHAVLDNRRAKAALGLEAVPWQRLLDDCVEEAGLA